MSPPARLKNRIGFPVKTAMTRPGQGNDRDARRPTMGVHPTLLPSPIKEIPGFEEDPAAVKLLPFGKRLSRQPTAGIRHP
jgi:hypothetical protein